MMRGVLLFAGVILSVFLGWLLWRVNGAIGEDALMLIFGTVIGVAICVPVAVIVLVVAQIRHEDGPEPAPQLPVAQPPVVVYLSDGSRSSSAPYGAPARLQAPPPSQAKRQPAQDEAWMKPAFRVVGENESYVDEW